MPDGTISRSNQEAFFRVKDSIGAGTVRTPFVDLFIGKHRINLQGGRATPGAPRDEMRAEIPDSSLLPLYLIDFRYATSNGLGVAQDLTLTLLDPNWDYLESLIASNVSRLGKFSFNFGWRGIHDRTGSLPTAFIVRDFTVSYLPFQGAKVSLQGIDASVALSFARAGPGFTANQRIDQVIKTVIERVDSNFEVEIDKIEQTIGADHSRMENRTVVEYVNHLLDIASGSSGLEGSSNFIMRTERGSTPEKTKIIISADVPKTHVIRNYIIGRERQGTMFEFTPSVAGSMILSLGGGKASGAAVDERTKKVIKVTSTHLDATMRTGDRTMNKVPKEDSCFVELPFSDLSAIRGFTKGIREAIDTYQFNATAVVLGDPGLTPQQQVFITVLKSNAPGSDTEQITDKSIVHTSGVYRIYEAEHIISAGMFRTNLTLYREAGFFGAGEKGIKLPIKLEVGLPDTVGIKVQNASDDLT